MAPQKGSPFIFSATTKPVLSRYRHTPLCCTNKLVNNVRFPKIHVRHISRNLFDGEISSITRSTLCAKQLREMESSLRNVIIALAVATYNRKISFSLNNYWK